MTQKLAVITSDKGLFVIWAVLVALTVLSVGVLGLTNETTIAVAVLTLGFIKAAMVLWTFMEAPTAPTLVKTLTMVWTVTVWAVVIAMFVTG